MMISAELWLGGIRFDSRSSLWRCIICLFYLFIYLNLCVCFRAAQIELLHALAGISDENNLGQGISVKIKFNIIASLYDYNPNLATFMKVGNVLFSWVVLSWYLVQTVFNISNTFSECSSVSFGYLFFSFFFPPSAHIGGYVEEVSGLHWWTARHPFWEQQHLHWREHRWG